MRKKHDFNCIEPLLYDPILNIILKTIRNDYRKITRSEWHNVIYEYVKRFNEMDLIVNKQNN